MANMPPSETEGNGPRAAFPSHAARSTFKEWKETRKDSGRRF